MNLPRDGTNQLPKAGFDLKVIFKVHFFKTNLFFYMLEIA